MNKKLLKISLLVLGAFFASAHADCDNSCDSTDACKPCNGDEFGKTFLFVRPNFQIGMPEVETFWRRKAKVGCCGENYAECAWGGAVQVVGFGGRSTKSCHLGTYFSPINCCTFTMSTTSGSDVNPINFGVALQVIPAPATPGSLSGTLTLRPRQTFAGVGFEWRQYFGWWNCDCDDSRWWFDISFPFESIRNRVRLTEVIASTTGTPLTGGVATMTEGLAGLATFGGATAGINPGGTSARPMQFGLIPTGTNRCHGLKRNGVADVTVRIGWDAYCCDTCYVNGYIGGLAPTGNRPRGRFIFEPIVGHNRHAGVVFGGLMSYDFWTCEDSALSWEVNVDSLYLFKGKETRSFDLKNHGPWSRYLLVYANAADAAAGVFSPGINFFTQDFNVTPRFWTSINSALVYNTMCGFEAEIGWNFWAKNAEKVRLKNPFPTGIFVAAIDPLNSSIDGFTNLLSTIGNNNSCTTNTAPCTSILDTALASTLPLTEADIDCRSIVNDAAITNMIYGALGYNFDWCCVPMWIGIGGSYEFAAVNTALSRWTVWGKWGISF